MTSVFDGAEEGSARASWAFMARSYTGQVWVRNYSRRTSLVSASCARLS
jgi:hypothetical protein